MLFLLLFLACMQVFNTLEQSICWRQDIENFPFYVDFLVVLQNCQFEQLAIIQGVFFYWSPQKSLSMELALPPQHLDWTPPNTESDHVC